MPSTKSLLAELLDDICIAPGKSIFGTLLDVSQSVEVIDQVKSLLHVFNAPRVTMKDMLQTLDREEHAFDKAYFFTYGSMVNIEQARDTIGDDADSFQRAFAVGIRPFFGFDLYHHKDKISPRHPSKNKKFPYQLEELFKRREEDKGSDRAALCVTPTGPDQCAMGAVYQLSPEKLRSFCEREKYYDFKQAPTIIIDKDGKPEVVIAYYLVLKKELQLAERERSEFVRPDGTVDCLNYWAPYQKACAGPYRRDSKLKKIHEANVLTAHGATLFEGSSLRRARRIPSDSPYLLRERDHAGKAVLSSTR